MRENPTAIALGFFDGVHIAHQKIIKSTVSFAKKNGLFPVALSFDASPMEILSPEKIRYITSNKDKQQLIENLGAHPEFLSLSPKLLSMEAEEFVEKILVNVYNIRYAACGYNYRFGKGGHGDVGLLKELGCRFGFTVEVFDCETLYGESVSSSLIRNLITDGSISKANELLGRNFSIEGIVTEGKKLGRKLGYPTANVIYNEKLIIPKRGVYKTLITTEGQTFKAITNTGINPTVGGERLRTETYIPEFNDILYGKEIKIEFIDFIRAEKKFTNIEELKAQIAKDIQKLNYLR